jgi:phosphoglycerate dehydrogenase-like enzyme
MNKIAVTSRSFSRNALLRRELELRYENSVIDFNDTGRSLDGRELIDFLRGHDSAIVALEKITEEVLSELPELKVISKYGVGTDNLDITAMHRHRVRLGWTGGVNRRSVSELVISVAISLLRHVPKANREVLQSQWRQHIGRQLSGKTVGIIGCGHIGKDLVQLLRPFGCRVLANDIVDYYDFYHTNDVEPMELDRLLTQADIVTLHLPYDVTTRNILSENRLALMRSTAILINTARGGLVDEAKLKLMLQNGELAGAAFDVFAIEPPEDCELIQLPNFLATPHIGGSAEEAIIAMGRAAIDGLSI